MSRRDYEEGREDARQELREPGGPSRGGGDKAFTAAIIVKYIAVIVIVIIVAYVVLRVLNTVQSAL